jgi:hypothetical protein
MDLLAQALNQLAPKDVGIEEFTESSDYCNKALYPPQRVLLKTIFLEELTGEEEDILTYWINGGHNGTDIVVPSDIRDRVEWLRGAGYSHFREIALVGGRRSSKGFCTGVAMAKSMWNCLQLQDPGAHYGIDPEKEIYFSCIAGSQEQAQGRQYSDFSSTIETCKVFDPYLVKSLETEIRVATSADLRRISQEKSRGNRIQKDIARLRGNAMAANAGTIRGLAMMAYCIDEVAFMLPGESKSSPNKIYEAANPSLGQFGVDGLAFLNSSPYTKIGLFYEKYVEGLIAFDPNRPVDEPAPLMEDGFDLKDRNGEPRLLVFQFPSWGLYEGYQKAKNRTQLKSVLMASPDWDPNEKDEDGEELWTAKDKQLIRTARAEEQANPEGFKVEYRGKFAEVTDAYMEPRRIDEMFAGLPNEWIYDENSDNPEIPRLSLVPFRSNTGKDATNMFRYKFHLDPSSTTAGFGFAIAHSEMIEDWKGTLEEHVVFDLIKRWEPKKFPGRVIVWPTILDEVMKYAEFFFPFEITFDQHESTQPVQELSEKLNERNIPTRVYIKPATAELNWHRWEVTKTSIYAKLVHAPNDTEDTRWCSQELKFLQIQGGTSKFPRVDRQEIGPVQTKDMADCVAECINTLIGNRIANRTRDRLSSSAVLGGAEGGYGIGFSGTGPKGGAGPEGISEYYGSKERKAQQEYQSPTRGALGRGRGRRGSNRARWRTRPRGFDLIL